MRPRGPGLLHSQQHPHRASWAWDSASHSREVLTHETRLKSVTESAGNRDTGPPRRNTTYKGPNTDTRA